MYKPWETIIQLNAAGKTRLNIESDKNGCFECETEDCGFNDDGICRFFAVHHKPPVVTLEDGCLSGLTADEYL